MANIYIPFDLEIKNILSNTVVITWDVSNVIEFRSGTKYKIYTSPDGGNYTLQQTVQRTEAAVPILPDNKYIRITSHTPTLGESDYSVPMVIKDPTTLTQYESPFPVAVDEDGKSRAVKINEDGRLQVSAKIEGDPGGTGAAAVEQITILNEIKQSLLPSAAKEDKQDSIIAKLTDTETILSEIKSNTQAGNLKVSEMQLTASGTDGTRVTLPFWERANILQFTVLHEAGPAEAFAARIWRKKTSSSVRDILAEFASYDEPRLDVLKTIPYINLDEESEITLEIVPDSGPSNIFYVRIAGSLAY